MSLPIRFWWQTGAVVALVLVLTGVAFGRPDPEHFRVREVAAPACAPDAGRSALSAGLTGATLVASATVDQVTDQQVTLRPDHYYYGASSWAPLKIRIDRAGWSGVTWTPGTRYLVAAQDGTLLECGQTQTWSPAVEQALRAHFH